MSVVVQNCKRELEGPTHDAELAREPHTTHTASRRISFALGLLAVLFCSLSPLLADSRTLPATRQYLNIPIARQAPSQLITISVKGVSKRIFPVQLAESQVDYWIYIDITEFKGQSITLSGSASQAMLARIYEANTIEGQANLYKEAGRPQFHFTVKRGWNNDVNGPIFYNGQYHLFWQAFPFGVIWNTGFMYWGHAVSKDLIHWRELPAALMLDKLGSPWSGTALVDHRNDGGWGKDTLVLVYTAFDRATEKQVQCIAYSKDNGATFTRFEGNPILDSNSEMGTTQTRDPKVFWYAPAQHWVMVLFEKDGMSFYTSTNLKAWTKKSHFKGLHECPDFFEMPVDKDRSRMKWVLHGGSSTYYIGTFDGDTFTPESPALRYAEGKSAKGEDLLYAAESFAEMPKNRRVQMAWGRIKEKDMPFTEMILFPTEFRLTTTVDGLRLLPTPVQEIQLLHGKQHVWTSLSAEAINQQLLTVGSGPLHVKTQVSLQPHDILTIKYGKEDLVALKPEDFPNGHGSVELLIDKFVAEIFVDGGRRYIVRQLSGDPAGGGLSFHGVETAGTLDRVELYEMKSMWNK